MQELITITTDEQGSLAVNTLDFANGLGIQHKNLLETIRTHQEAIERDFGRIAFQTQPLETGGGKQKGITAYLTEDQALFVGTLSRNSKRVVEFKSTLVRSFAEARKRLQPEPVPILSTEQILLQLAQQQTQLLTTQQDQLNQLRADVENLMAGHQPANSRPARLPRPGQQLALPGMPTPSPPGPAGLRPLIARRVNDYCGYHGAEPGDNLQLPLQAALRRVRGECLPA